MHDKINKIKVELQQFCRMEIRYKIPLIGTRFIEGLKYLAHETNGFWLITDTAVIAKRLSNSSAFITIDFKRLSEKKRIGLHCEAILN